MKKIKSNDQESQITFIILLWWYPSFMFDFYYFCWMTYFEIVYPWWYTVVWIEEIYVWNNNFVEFFLFVMIITNKK